MKQIVQSLKDGSVSLEDLPVPRVGKGMVLIQTKRTLVSLGTERMLIEFGRASLWQKARSRPDKVKQVLQKIRSDALVPTAKSVFRRLDEPLPLGYSNAGTPLIPCEELGNSTQATLTIGELITTRAWVKVPVPEGAL